MAILVILLSMCQTCRADEFDGDWDDDDEWCYEERYLSDSQRDQFFRACEYRTKRYIILCEEAKDNLKSLGPKNSDIRIICEGVIEGAITSALIPELRLKCIATALVVISKYACDKYKIILKSYDLLFAADIHSKYAYYYQDCLFYDKELNPKDYDL